MHKKLWMLPISLLLLAVAGFCFWSLYLSWKFTLPARAAVQLSSETDAHITRSAYVQPTEPPTEEPTTEAILLEMPVSEPEPIAVPEPVKETPYSMQINMSTVSAHHNTNPEVVGWIKISGTVINYPVMQKEGDNDYYVNHAWNGASSSAGAIFTDFRSRMDISDNILMYGHNMGNGSMFHAIKNYKTQSWGRSHPYIEFATLEHRYLYKVFSCNVVSGEAGAKFEYWNFIEMNRTDYRNFINGIRNTATVWYGDDRHLPRDNHQKFITLQTCNSGANDGIRCLVFAYCVGER